MCDTDTKCAWKTYINTYFQEEAKQTLLYNTAPNDYPAFKDQFYKEICKIICNNSYIRIEGTPIAKKRWGYNNLRFIQNLLDDEGKIDIRENLEKKYNVQINPMCYNSLISAIPHKWKKMIKDDTNVNNYYVFADYKVTIDGNERKLVEITSKQVYTSLVDKIFKRATSEEKWEEETGINYDAEQWEYVYTFPYEITRDVRILTFQYKITHRTLACKRNLKTWKIKIDNICDVCKNETDGIEHHLVACPVLLEFWDSFFHWWKAVSKMSFPIDTYDIIFGIPNPNDDIIVLHINYLILHALYYIYVTKKTPKKPMLYEFILEAKKCLIIKQHNMENNGQQKKFEQKWAPLTEILL
jgi:hypothetical protein